MADARFIVGIDLGTTNSAVATLDSRARSRRVEVLPIAQVVAAGEVGARDLLPSALYLPGEHELSPRALALPWGEPPFAVGHFAREQGARVPGRVVTSAKSWLCHAGVDRTAPILPWGAPPQVQRLSPVDASARLLAHLKAAWEERYRSPLADQDVVLTVPASFDEGARELTLEAATQAGLAQVTLLEEPLAAFYHWLEGHEQKLDEALAGVSLVLVVDIGGGTTDLTLIQARHDEDGLRLDRVAVGDHLLLGGDNIDLALAHLAEKRLSSGSLDAASWGSLVLSARSAKEALLSENAPETRSITILGRTAKLVGGARKVEVTAEEVRRLVLDGFFPLVARDARPERKSGLRELGLPYASDPAVTRHLAVFLARQLGPTQGVDAVLFNGGALTPCLVADRLVDQLEAWNASRPKVLPNEWLDLAVARGAAHFGLARRGEGLRVGGGSARAFFLGVGTASGHQGVCVVPKGLPEGVVLPLAGRDFKLTVGRPVRFELYSSTGRRPARVGELIEVEGADDLVRLPPIQTVVRASSGAGELSVRVEAGVTEIGTLALWCVSGADRLKLEFQLRGGSSDRALYETASLPRRFQDAKDLVEKFFGKKPSDVDPREVKGLARSLERILGEREAWTLPMLRELWSVLWAGAQKRRRSVDHEKQWLMLASYSLRPGFGAALDDWRAKETFTIFPQGLQFHQDKAQWDQWWILWRRIAGGLDEAAQASLCESARPWLAPVPAGKSRPRPKGPRVEGFEELVRLVASLERVPVGLKREVGGWLWSRIESGQPGGSSFWVLGRLGARVPFYGSAHLVLPTDDVEEWIERLLQRDWSAAKDAPFATAMLARATGDRARDVSQALRGRVIERLEAAKANASWTAMVRAPVALAQADEQRLFGDSLPAGLQLVE